jgi:hypothetical protein
MVYEVILILGLAASVLSTLILGLAKAVAHFSVVTYTDESNPDFLEEVLPWHGVIPVGYVSLFLPFIYRLNSYNDVPEHLRAEAKKYTTFYQISVLWLFVIFLSIIYFLD